jgi:hypothetical protein
MAHAVERFPPAITRALQLTYEPPCSLCHLKANIDVVTVGTPFALSMRARGMTSGNVNEMTAALNALKTDRVDDDGDGVDDVDELIAGTDPNTPASSTLRDRTDPSYGCGGGSRGQRQGRAPLSMILLAPVAAIVRRARHARPSPKSPPHPCRSRYTS